MRSIAARPFTRVLAVILTFLASFAGCSPPPAIVGEGDELARGELRPIYADDDSLFFHYSNRRDPDGPTTGLYRIPLSGGAPSFLLASSTAWDPQRDGDDLVVLTYDGWRLTTVPLDGSASQYELLANGVVGWASSSGYTFLLHSFELGEMAITRMATETEPAVRFAMRENAFPWGDLHADAGYLYWQERDGVMRIADDMSQPEPQLLSRPDLSAVPIHPDGYDDSTDHVLLGFIGGELYARVYQETFYPTGGSDTEGLPHGYRDYSGGAIYKFGLSSAASVIAVDIRSAVLSGDVIYAQTRDLETVRIDPVSGETTRLAGRAQPLEETPVVNEDTLFYTDEQGTGSAIRSAIRYVSLAPAD